ncbi:hypothetical protein FS749_014584 [Ceratobasidium sp. UAMH 11750]|nr:hypothetical protein FS749_014584 [Ceratobasidium sp. UAMH 11750]
MSDSESDDRGVSILVGDSSGAGALSTITTLDEMMRRVQAENGLKEPPLVGEYFDIVAGGGTAAIIAVMVGRLGMTTEQAMTSLARLANEVFSDKKTIGEGTFKASKMEKALKDIIRRVTGNENEPMLDKRADSRECKTMVFAMSKHNMNAGIPAIFRSYSARANQGPNSTIWEALRAATAHPEMFKSIEIEDQGIRGSFVDAAMGCSNPIEHVLAEAKLLYPNRRVACILSIGGGHPRTIHIPEPSPFQRIFPTSLIVAMRDIATDNERMAQTMAVRFQAVPDVYFRLNVDQGMQSVRIGSWDRLGEIKAHTRAYMLKAQTNEIMKKAARAIVDRRGTIAMDQIDGQIMQEPELGVKQCPAPTPVYIERHKPIEQAIGCLTSSTQERRIFVFHGLGGTGKTQLALQTIERTRDHWSDVIYVDATSAESLKAALKDIALARRIGRTYNDALLWLSSYTKPWLLMFDNADDPSIGLSQYFPSGTHGRILVTTRSRDIALLAKGPDSDYNVSAMEPAEGLQLLMTVSRMNDQTLSDEEKGAAIGILQAVGYLALAIVQAGAYVWRVSCSFAHYLDLYAKQPQVTLEKYSQMPVKVDDYQKTVYATWKMSYSLLSDRAQQMLWLLAYLKRDQITEDLFRHAAAGIKVFQNRMTASEDDQEPLAYVSQYLNLFLDTNHEWDTGAFMTVVAELVSCSLISVDRINRTYELHVLVQDWVRTSIPHSPEIGITHTVYLLGLSAIWEESLEGYTFRRSLQWHIWNVLKHINRINTGCAICFANVLSEAGHFREASELRTKVVDNLKEMLGERDPFTLGHMSNLGLTYSHQGLYKQAEALLARVLAIREQVLGEKHTDTLLSMHNLASVLFHQGLYKEAEFLQTQALEGLKQTLGDQDLSTLSVMDNLANSYAQRGLRKEAEVLRVQVVEGRRQRLGGQHPDTLAAMHNLAGVYHLEGLYKQAETLQVQILAARRQISGDRHPHTLLAMQNLATIYYDQGLWKQAETLHTQVLEGRNRTLGTRHPDTLSSMSQLAHTFLSQGLYERDPLLIRALEGFKQVLGEQHPDTLHAMNGLANSYSEQGLLKQAEPLQIKVLESRKQRLGDQHPDTLSVMHNLAVTYAKQKRYKEAGALWDEVVATREKTLGGQHPMTLSAMENVAATYSDQLLWEESRVLLTRILEGRNQALGKQHPETLLIIIKLAYTFYGQGLYNQAESLQTHALEGLTKALGQQHPHTIQAMHYLAVTYSQQGLYKEAERLQVQLLADRKQKLGDLHPATLYAMLTLAYTYYQQGLYNQAETLQVQTLEGRREVLGEQHPDTLSATNALNATYQKLGISRQHGLKAFQMQTGKFQPVMLGVHPVRSPPWIKVVMLLLLIVSPVVVMVFFMVPPPPPPRKQGYRRRNEF